MVVLKLLLTTAACGLVAAWPEPSAAARLEQRAVDCAKVTGALSVLKKIGPPATSFCSWYLKIQGTKTVTTTFTPTTVTSTISTTTITTTTSSVCGQQKRNVPIEYRGFQYAKPADLERRTDILPLLVAFAAAKISEGCSCLSLQPKATTTTTSTVAAPTVNVVATRTACVTTCKVSSLNSQCSSDSQCCSGFCRILFNLPSCCDPLGSPCSLGNPSTCCSATCSQRIADGPGFCNSLG